MTENLAEIAELMLRQAQQPSIDDVLSSNGSFCTADPDTWPAERRLVAAAQVLLSQYEFRTSPADGVYDAATADQIRRWLILHRTGVRVAS